ncbi:MAG: hypothetical protein Q4C65_03635 [Eubacteriales bacterium]|nr:hypothetical protein [Eubacteriales bacterium]
MTVEAALVLPLFLFAAVNLLSLLLMFSSYSAREAGLHQTGRQLSMLGYGQESGEREVRLMYINRISAPFSVAAFGGGYTVNGCVMYKWIGYELGQTGEEEQRREEELVYITSSGEAYHRERGCQYLNPSIRMVERSQAKEDGRYTPCLACGGNSSLVYVTEGGSRYHSTVGCSGLKRTIESVTLPEAEGRGYHACPGCG